MKLLIDEDLSPMVALKLCKEDNLDAAHVRERGLLGEPDHVLKPPFAHDHQNSTQSTPQPRP